MPIYTTYLGNKPKAQAQKLGSCFVYYVMRNRGNNEVAPIGQVFIDLTKDKAWGPYEYFYKQQLQENPASIKWMEKRAQEAKVGNILLVCYEKDATHCHRRLLAEEIARRFGVEYKGDLTPEKCECHYFRATIKDGVCQDPRKHDICKTCRFNKGALC